jgi:hypothetical protein
VNRTALVIFSLIADVLDFFIAGQIPLLSWIIDIPVLIMHVVFAGAKGLLLMFEMIPVVGTIPLFTAMALFQKPKHG